MAEQERWDIEQQPIEYQAQYWRLRAENAERKLSAAQRRKTPPEREAFERLQEEVGTVRETIRIYQADAETWKRVARQLGEEITALKAGTALPRLEHERDHWKQQWRNCTRRLADAIEHGALFGYTPVASRDAD